MRGLEILAETLADLTVMFPRRTTAVNPPPLASLIRIRPCRPSSKQQQVSEYASYR